MCPSLAITQRDHYPPADFLRRNLEPDIIAPTNEGIRVAPRIFRSEQGKVRLEGWYDRFLSRIPAPVVRREISTVHGPSHVLLAGDEANPPLVCLHGALASSAHILSELGPLSDRFRIIAPDLPGQSVRGPRIRLPLHRRFPRPLVAGSPRWARGRRDRPAWGQLGGLRGPPGGIFRPRPDPETGPAGPGRDRHRPGLGGDHPAGDPDGTLQVIPLGEAPSPIPPRAADHARRCRLGPLPRGCVPRFHPGHAHPSPRKR